MNDAREFFTINGTALALSVSRSTVYARLRDGSLKGVRLGDKTLIHKSQILGLGGAK